ncbi:GMP reductase [Bombilactobacillus thymidiniphilus]|uniref:GMP reductase n=1 Tax=Bombilactobacillus thymidiniphilus TaxID=2923363 RepID=A0ABY4PC00_9LACO|nr:GMP reductase [Bombilactobacillus thymidiniphilus]UQS83284.1 GMP reductase [Bombilactobacillus thymidiniphilus]
MNNNAFPVFDYENIQLIPKKCILEHRHQADTSVKLGQHTFKLPIIPANMASIIDEQLAIWLATNNYFYIMHRFEPQKRLKFIQKLHSLNLIASISVGIKAEDYQLIDNIAMQKQIPEYITIDIAHGHSDAVADMIAYIKNKLPDTFVIAGNVATPEAVHFLEAAGADATKMGIGPGKACITKIKTGFGTAGWQLSALRMCAHAAQKPIITDGGIRSNGDIAKSLRFGAKMVMVGSMLAGHDENPGEVLEVNEQKVKVYYGSASQAQKKIRKNIEGKKLTVPYRGSIKDTLKEMQEDIQSAISYAGGNKIADLQKVDYVVVRNSIFNGD